MGSQRRFKTEQEFIKELGQEWRHNFRDAPYFPVGLMNALGEPYTQVGFNLKVSRCIGRYHVSPQMLTEAPLLPIGTKVCFPANPSMYIKNKYEDIPCVALSKNPDAVVTYIGIAPGSTGHRLRVTSDCARRKAEGYFSANEILQGYELYQMLNAGIEQMKAMRPIEGAGKFVVFGTGGDVGQEQNSFLEMWMKAEKPKLEERLGNYIVKKTGAYTVSWDPANNSSPGNIVVMKSRRSGMTEWLGDRVHKQLINNLYENKSTNQKEGSCIEVRAVAISITRGNIEGRAIVQGGAVEANIVSGSFGYQESEGRKRIDTCYP